MKMKRDGTSIAKQDLGYEESRHMGLGAVISRGHNLGNAMSAGFQSPLNSSEKHIILNHCTWQNCIIACSTELWSVFLLLKSTV